MNTTEELARCEEEVRARLEHEVHHRAQISTYWRMLGEQWPTPYSKLP